MALASVLFRPGRHYRQELFYSGLRKHGYKVIEGPASHPSPEDVLVLWNRFQRDEQVARSYEKAGARVLITENGYIGQDDKGQGLFAMAQSQHNGAGSWPIGGPERWEKMHVELNPWRSNGDCLLLLPQRGLGPPGIAMPQRWEQFMIRKLGELTRRSSRLRPHPGLDKSNYEPYKDLRGCWAAVTWGSGAAIKALAEGYPVFHEMPNWIGASAAVFMGGKRFKSIEEPFLGDRLPMFGRLAWAQYSSEEVESGFAFSWLLGLE